MAGGARGWVAGKPGLWALLLPRFGVKGLLRIFIGSYTSIKIVYKIIEDHYMNSNSTMQGSASLRTL